LSYSHVCYITSAIFDHPGHADQHLAAANRGQAIISLHPTAWLPLPPPTRSDLSCNSCAAWLEGPVYPELALLDSLVQLNLAGNALSGPLPELWGRNNTFVKLVELNLNDNQLSGQVRRGCGNCSSSGAGVLQ